MVDHNPGKVAQFARRVWDVDIADDRLAAIEGINRLKDFYRSIGMPVTIKELGIENPDIDLLVKKLHENKGEVIGGYHRLTATETEQIYRLAL
jgi:alcohol dehydrogenase YqhD (iron-dependent ADH family)